MPYLERESGVKIDCEERSAGPTVLLSAGVLV